MAGKAQDYRIFVGGLSWNITERQLEDAFGRFGKVLECQVMLERDTGRPRGFGFLTFADRRGMEDAIHDMHGREFGERVISVNKAQPKLGDEDSGGRGSYGGGDRSAGQGECFKCGRPGHWAQDCPSAGSGRTFSPPRSKYGGAGGRGDHFANDRGQYVDDKYDRGRYGNRDRYDSKDDRYGSRDRYVNDRMAGKSKGICHSCRVAGHVLQEYPRKRRCQYCGEGFVRWLEVAKNSDNKEKLFHSGRRFFDFSKVPPVKVYPLQGESSGTTNGNEVIGDLSRMLKTCAKITEERDVEISLNITMRKGKAVPRG